MKNNIIKLICAGITILIPDINLAQSRILEHYLQEGLKNNQALLQEALELAHSEEVLNEARGNFMPNLSFNASYTLANGGRGIQVPIGDLLNPVYEQLDFPVRLENVNEQLLPNNFHETKIRLIQPIFNTDIYYNYLSRQRLVSAKQARLEAYKSTLVKEIKVGYYNYLKAIEALEIYNNTHVLLTELLRVNRKLVTNQKATKDVIYSAQYELSQLNANQAEAIRNRKMAAAYFNFLLNRPLQKKIAIDSAIHYDVNRQSLQESQTAALNQRQELKQLNHTIEASHQIVKLYQGNKLPKLALIADVGYQGFEYKFDNSQDFWLVNFSLQWPLFKGLINKSKVEQSKINIDMLSNQYRTLENQIKLQVINAWYDLKATENQFKAKSDALSSAAQTFKIVQRKYKEGLALLVEYLDVQTKFTNTQLQVVMAQNDLLIKKAELDNVISNYQ